MKFRPGIHFLPSLFTTGNVFCGFYAIIAAMNNQIYMAAWAIVLGTVFDALDGRIARLTKTTSAFGVQYDSLADIISFGMAPAILIFIWQLKPFGRVGWMAAFLFLICGALRLARFNAMDPELKENHFIGLPIPAAALVIVSIVIATEDKFFTKLHPVFIVIIVYLLAFLMVSNIKYPAFKKLNLKKRVSFTRFVFFVLLLYVFATIPRIFLLILSLSYTLLGPLKSLGSLFDKKPDPETQKTRKIS